MNYLNHHIFTPIIKVKTAEAHRRNVRLRQTRNLYTQKWKRKDNGKEETMAKRKRHWEKRFTGIGDYWRKKTRDGVQ
jgi:hypothetical protein